MFDTILTVVFVLLAALVTLDAFRKWRALKNNWFVIAAAVAGLAALGFIVSWTDGFYAIVVALILRVVAGMMAKRKKAG